MYGELGFNAVRKTVQLVKFTGSGCSIIFASAQIKLLSTTGYKALYGTYLAAQQQNKLIQFPICANVGVRFSLEKFCHRLVRRTYKLDLLFSTFGFGVLPSQKC